MVGYRVLGFRLLPLLLATNISALLNPFFVRQCAEDHKGGGMAVDAPLLERNLVIFGRLPEEDMIQVPARTYGHPLNTLKKKEQKRVGGSKFEGQVQQNLRTQIVPHQGQNNLGSFRQLRSCHSIRCSQSMDHTIGLLMRMMEMGKK